MKNRRFLLLIWCAALMAGWVMPVHAEAQPAIDPGQIRERIGLVSYLENFSPHVRPIDTFNNWDNSIVRAVQGAALSPDGAQVAWYGDINQRVANLPADVLCLHTFARLETFCQLLPSSLDDLSPLRWSDDARFIFFTDERINSAANPDIWVFSVDEMLLLNITNAQPPANAEPAAAPHFAPTWDPFNQRLFFIRHTNPGQDPPIWELHHVTADQLDDAFAAYRLTLSESAQARADELAGTLDGRRDVVETRREEVENFGTSSIGMTGLRDIPSWALEGALLEYAVADMEQNAMPAIEPNFVGMVSGVATGSRIVDTYREHLIAPTHSDVGGLLMLVALNNVVDPLQGGVALIDLTSGGLIPLLTVGNIISAEPDWVQSFTLTGAQWTNDSTGVLFGARVEGQTASYGNLYHFSLTTGALNPLINYGELASEGAFFQTDAPALTADSAVLLPTDDVLYFNRSRRDTLYIVPVPPPARGSEPSILPLTQTLSQQRRLPSSIGVDGDTLYVLIDYNLLIIR